MKKKLINILGVILSTIILMYFESFIYEIINIIGIKIHNYSVIVQSIINLVIKLIMAIFIYFIYKKEFRSKRRTNNSLFHNIIVFVVSLVSIVIGMYIFSYVVNFIGDIFNIRVIENGFYNIFNKQINLELIIKIISDYIIIPYLYCAIILLSVDRIFNGNNTSIILSGVLASIINSVVIPGTLGFIIINSLNIFLLFSIFMYIYKKGYSIYFIICLYAFYLVSNVFILSYLGV